mmetsp:Transcript_152534/g.489176  ORF Transcript_152534/g.489176 Transcript_152534/m.489176 type:complete len:257 (+) Transcript_152534:405-1175(+)
MAASNSPSISSSIGAFVSPAVPNAPSGGPEQRQWYVFIARRPANCASKKFAGAEQRPPIAMTSTPDVGASSRDTHVTSEAKSCASRCHRTCLMANSLTTPGGFSTAKTPGRESKISNRSFVPPAAAIYSPSRSRFDNFMYRRVDGPSAPNQACNSESSCCSANVQAEAALHELMTPPSGIPADSERPPRSPANELNVCCQLLLRPPALTAALYAFSFGLTLLPSMTLNISNALCQAFPDSHALINALNTIASRATP